MPLAHRDATLRGMLISSYFGLFPEWTGKAAGWPADGSLRSELTVVDGSEQAPAALLGNLRGAGLGKMLGRPAGRLTPARWDIIVGTGHSGRFRHRWGAARMGQFDSIDDLLGHEGEVAGTTDWHLIDQARVDRFAEVTGDHQWIHVDVERGPRAGPVRRHDRARRAHLVAVHSLPLRDGAGSRRQPCGQRRLRSGALPGPGAGRFAPAGQRQADRLPADGAGTRVVVRVTAEIEGAGKPACVADQVLMFVR